MNKDLINNEKEEIDIKKFYIKKKKVTEEIEIGKNKYAIIIKNKNKQVILNRESLYNLTEAFNNINIAYDLLIKSFEEKNVLIKNKDRSKVIELIFKINKNEIQIDLERIKEDDVDLKNKLHSMNSFNNKKNINLEFLYDVNNSLAENNPCTIFNSVNNVLCMVFSNYEKLTENMDFSEWITNGNNSIICYNIIDNKVMIVIKIKCSVISIIQHYYDKENNRDLIITAYSPEVFEQRINIWNANDWTQVLSLVIKTNELITDLYSAILLNDNNNLYLVCGILDKEKDYRFKESNDVIKVFNLKGEEIKEIIENYNNSSYFIDSFYDIKLSKTFIITAGKGSYVKAYDFDSTKVYYRYDSFCYGIEKYCKVIILNNKENVKLIVPNEDRNIRIWDFHTEKLIKIIRVSNDKIYSTCLLDDNYLFVGGKDNLIKLVDLKYGVIVKTFFGHENSVGYIGKIQHNKYGECLISTGKGNYPIKMWKINIDVK